MEERLLGKSEKYGGIQVYVSAYPGLGKTHQILKEIKANQRQPLFFPISGRATT